MSVPISDIGNYLLKINSLPISCGVCGAFPCIDKYSCAMHLHFQLQIVESILGCIDFDILKKKIL